MERWSGGAGNAGHCKPNGNNGSNVRPPLQCHDRRGTPCGCPHCHPLPGNERHDRHVWSLSGNAGQWRHCGAMEAMRAMEAMFAPHCSAMIVGAPLVGARIAIHCHATNAMIAMYGRCRAMPGNAGQWKQCKLMRAMEAMEAMRSNGGIAGNGGQCATMWGIAGTHKRCPYDRCMHGRAWMRRCHGDGAMRWSRKRRSACSDHCASLG